MASVTWVGTPQAIKESSSIQKLNRDIIEYSEVWKGKHDGTGWPAYVIGGTISPTIGGVGGVALKWYDISVENPVRGAVASYTARASNRFYEVNPSYAEWSVDLDFQPSWIENSDMSSNFLVGQPVVKKVVYYLIAPAIPASGYVETPVPPFSILTPGLAPLPANWSWTFGAPTYQWVRSGEGMQQQNNIFVRTTTWSRILA
jgi:hypothetical protein